MIHERYIKVNLTAYHRCRTVEFRHHSGTCLATKVKNWVLFCVNFVDQSMLAAIENDGPFYGLEQDTVDYFNGRIEHFKGDTAREQEREVRVSRERAIRQQMREGRNTNAGRALWIGLHNTTQEMRAEITTMVNSETPDHAAVRRLATRMFYMQPTRGTRNLASEVRTLLSYLGNARLRVAERENYMNPNQCEV